VAFKGSKEKLKRLHYSVREGIAMQLLNLSEVTVYTNPY
jgi:hypothetical protein